MGREDLAGGAVGPSGGGVGTGRRADGGECVGAWLARSGAVGAGSDGFARAVPCSVGQLIALVRRAAVVMGGDTGPLHLAAALERPVVGIFGPTDPARNGPYGTRQRVLRDASSLTSHKRVSETEAGMLQIGVEEVVQAAMEMLG